MCYVSLCPNFGLKLWQHRKTAFIYCIFHSRSVPFTSIQSLFACTTFFLLELRYDGKFTRAFVPFTAKMIFVGCERKSAIGFKSTHSLFDIARTLLSARVFFLTFIVFGVVSSYRHTIRSNEPRKSSRKAIKILLLVERTEQSFVLFFLQRSKKKSLRKFDLV